MHVLQVDGIYRPKKAPKLPPPLSRLLFQDAKGLFQFEYFTTWQGANMVLTSLQPLSFQI